MRVAAGGTKAYILNYREEGKERRITLARAEAVTLKEARELASKALAGVRGAEARPIGQRKHGKAAATVNDALDSFFGEYVPARQAKGKYAPKTLVNYLWFSNKFLRPAIGKVAVAKLTKRDIEGMLEEIYDRPALHNRLLAFTKKLCRLFRMWGLRESNPAEFVEMMGEEERDRVLSTAELTALGQALAAEEAKNLAVVGAIRVAALTGLRIGEVLGIRWEDIDEAAGKVRLPNTKTGARGQIVLNAALEALKSQPHREGREHVFTTAKPPSLSYATVFKGWHRIIKTAGIEGATLHDLRRTLMTGGAKAGTSAHVLRDMLGHKSAAIADRYIHNSGAAAVDAIEGVSGGVSDAMNAGRS